MHATGTSVQTIKNVYGCVGENGDKYYVDDDGYYHCGRTDDMFKVSGNQYHRLK
ncbi:MAG: hypothetical protein ACNYPI_11775 [Arenicellales bacterium WSBS_2016_MAG_OTU3]